MPILNTVAQLAAKPFPPVITPKSRATLDRINAGILLISGVWFWHRNKRAAMGALIGGGAALALNLLTRYPNGRRNVLSFRSRRELELGLAGMISTMPEFLAFQDAEERKFFMAEGVLMAVMTELTQFPESRIGRKGFRAA